MIGANWNHQEALHNGSIYPSICHPSQPSVVLRWRLGTITRTSAWLCQYLQSQLAPTPQQHNNNQTIFWRHQYRKHQSDIVLCSTACTRTVWRWPRLTSPRRPRKQSAAIKTKLCVNCAGGGMYQHWINGELPTLVKSCGDAGQTVVTLWGSSVVPS